MSNERPDEFLAWRGRLGQPDALPEQGLDDREATWERLNARLGSVLNGERQPGRSVRPGEDGLDKEGAIGKGTRRRIYRYGIAAAFLLLALIPATRFFRGRPLAKGPVPVAIRQQARADRGATPMTPVIAEKVNPVPSSTPVAPIPVTTLREKRPAASWQRRVTGNVAVFQRRTPLAVQDLTPPAVAERQERLEAGAPADPGKRLAVIPSPARKPLRVVSINEIDDPVAPGPVITFHRSPVPFRVSLNPRASAMRMTTAVEEKEPPTLKIELNP